MNTHSIEGSLSYDLFNRELIQGLAEERIGRKLTEVEIEQMVDNLVHDQDDSHIFEELMFWFQRYFNNLAKEK